mgnify:CR=1 FL=1
MRALLQRVRRADVTVEGEVIGKIGQGLLVFLGVMDGDTESEMEYLAQKVAGIRIFCDENDKMNRSITDIGGDFLVVSQFTLGADCSHGKRPSFIKAARPEAAIPLYEQFCASLRTLTGREVQTGEFGADMDVSLVNDGPVTIWMDTDEMRKGKA